MRLLRIIIVLVVLVLIPFVIWGDQLMSLFKDATAARMWIENYGPRGWVTIMGLLVVDLFLPIPATAVMSAAGYMYGPWVGGIISLCGSLAAGILAYVLSRSFGRPAAEWLAGAEGLNENERLFTKSGPWLIILTRWVPVLPEVVACLAGIARMPVWLFLVSLLCGTVPPAFTYAAVGSLFDSEPAWALALSLVLPVLLWVALRPFLRARQSRPPEDS